MTEIEGIEGIVSVVYHLCEDFDDSASIAWEVTTPTHPHTHTPTHHQIFFLIVRTYPIFNFFIVTDCYRLLLPIVVTDCLYRLLLRFDLFSSDHDHQRRDHLASDFNTNLDALYKMVIWKVIQYSN